MLSMLRALNSMWQAGSKLPMSNGDSRHNVRATVPQERKACFFASLCNDFLPSNQTGHAFSQACPCNDVLLSTQTGHDGIPARSRTEVRTCRPAWRGDSLCYSGHLTLRGAFQRCLFLQPARGIPEAGTGGFISLASLELKKADVGAINKGHSGETSRNFSAPPACTVAVQSELESARLASLFTERHRFRGKPIGQSAAAAA
ncbi:unnamed protein product [Symbiodinium natans]|uniref:Uncharacterized protein n=1 Tax=Symbiodinium natans TaxID=878477 RepID=A0A812Q9Z2_9DINO|nr:unnamed protein product [Symbiodinium natans]